MYIAALVLFVVALSVIVVTTRRRSGLSEPGPGPEVEDAGAPNSRETGAIESETLAVIAAAARVAAGPGARVRKVRVQDGSSAWAEFGRMGIHGSHKIRKVSK
jgi:hypothetical protein